MRKGLLRGGPADGHTLDDVPEMTEYVNVPAKNFTTDDSEAQSALYRHAGVDRDGGLLFDFVVGSER